MAKKMKKANKKTLRVRTAKTPQKAAAAHLPSTIAPSPPGRRATSGRSAGTRSRPPSCSSWTRGRR
jgi:hypothetical protein